MSTPLGHIKYCIAFKSKILKLICLKKLIFGKYYNFFKFWTVKKASKYVLTLFNAYSTSLNALRER